MKKSASNHVRHHKPKIGSIIIGGVILLYVLTSLLILNKYKYALNPDGVAYIEIAKKYAHWQISKAVNGYWSPLTSWLLVPFVWLHANLQIAYRLLATASSVLALLAIWKIITKTTTKLYLHAAVLIVAAVLLLEWSFAGVISGDIFFVTAALWLALSFNNYISKRSWPSIILLAVNGAVLYFSKSIGFFVFLGILVISLILEYRKSRISELCKGYVFVGIFFLIVTLPFIGAISYKYKTLTVSTAGEINFLLATQYSATDPYIHPIIVSGPYAPKPGDITAWEDPTVFTAQMKHTFHVTKQSTLINNYYHSLINNLNIVLIGLQPVALIVGAVGIYLLGKRQKTIAYVLALACGISLLGYVLTYLELRYLYIVSLAILIGLAAVIDSLPRKIAVLGSCLLILLTIQPLQILISQSSADNDAYYTAKKVAKIIPSGVNVLSDSFSSIYDCYYDQFRCYSTVVSVENLASYIKANDIHYFLLFNGNDIISKPGFWQVMKQQKITVVDAQGSLFDN